jgi:hypothetical protein
MLVVCLGTYQIQVPGQPLDRPVGVGIIELRIVRACTAAVCGNVLSLKMCSVVLVATHVI